MKFREDTYYIRLVLNGDTSAYRSLVEKHQDLVYTIVHRIVSRSEEAEEVAQDVFVKAFQKISGFKAEAKFSTWLYRIVANLCFNVIRANKTAKQISIHSMGSEDQTLDLPDEGQQSPDAGLVGDERSKRVAAAVAKLPENQRLAIILNKYEDKSYAEIAEILDTTTMAVKSLLSRARVTLREQLEGYFKNE